MTSPQSSLVLIESDVLATLIQQAVAASFDEFSTVPPLSHEVLTRAEAASFLRMSLSALDRLVRAGTLPFHIVGDSRRFLRSELIEAVRVGCPSRDLSVDSTEYPAVSGDSGHQTRGHSTTSGESALAALSRTLKHGDPS